jgi:hypothetical protein
MRSRLSSPQRTNPQAAHVAYQYPCGKIFNKAVFTARPKKQDGKLGRRGT